MQQASKERWLRDESPRDESREMGCEMKRREEEETGGEGRRREGKKKEEEKYGGQLVKSCTCRRRLAAGLI